MMSGQVGRGDDGKQLSDSMGNQASLALARMAHSSSKAVSGR